MKIEQIKGIIPPIVTPIDKDEKIDEAKFRKQIDFVVNGGVHGILLFGSNGEFYMVDDDEMKRGMDIALDHNKKRVPLYFGIGAIRTRTCIRYAQMAKAAGCDAISILPPMFLKPTETELYEHISAVAKSVDDMPVIMYNNPGRVGHNMSVGVTVKLANEVSNIVGIKDSGGDMTHTADLICRTDPAKFKVFGGKDTLIYGIMAHGGAGAVATCANVFPELVCEIYEKYVAGDIKGSLAAQYRLMPVRISMDKASFPVATKDMANLAGLDVGPSYRPSINSQGATLEFMKQHMKDAGLL